MFNYSAGPGCMPEEVLRQIQDEVWDCRQSGVGILEHSHRARTFDAILAEAEQDCREVGSIPAGYRVRFTGTLASTAASTEVMVHGKIRNIVQVGAITFLVSALLLRSLVGGVLVVVPLVLTVIVSFGTMGMLGIPLDTMTAAISAMAIGIGADYAMYVLARVREEVGRSGDLDRGVAAAIRTSGKAVLFVSSELDEIARLADRIVVLRERRVAGELPGGSDEATIGRLITGAAA